MLLQNIVQETTKGSAADLQTTEPISERTYGLWQVFKDVKKESDWRKPRNPPRGWKSKVKWHMLKEFDAAMKRLHRLVEDQRATANRSVNKNANITGKIISTELAAARGYSMKGKTQCRRRFFKKGFGSCGKGGMETLHASGDLRSGEGADGEHTQRCLAARRVVDNAIRSQFASAAVKEKSRLQVLEWLQRRECQAAAAAEGPDALFLAYHNREICKVMHDLNSLRISRGWPRYFTAHVEKLLIARGASKALEIRK